MKILFITFFNPFSHEYGGEQRTNIIFNTFKSFAEVDALVFNKSKKNISNHQNNVYYHDQYFINPIVRRLHSLFCLCFTPCKPNFEWHEDKVYSKVVRECIEKTKYDFICFRGIKAYLMCGANKLEGNIIIDVDDVPYHTFCSTYRNVDEPLLRRFSHFYAYPFVKFFCKKCLAKVSFTFFSNKNDCFGSNSIYLPNIPYTKMLKPQQWTPNHNILFVGSLSYPPNVAGINHFITHIWCKVRVYHPDVKLYIVGGGLTKKKKKTWEKDSSIYLLGYVEELSDIYNKCAIVVTPIYVGAGTNIKLLEALYMSKICVASSFSMKGFQDYFKDKEDLFIAHDDSEYVDKLNYTLSHIDKLEIMGKRGHEIICNSFSEEQLNTILKNVFS